MIQPCRICGVKEEPKLEKEEEELVDFMFDFLSEQADIEGPGILTDIEFDFICGGVCNKCYLQFLRSIEERNNL